MDYLKLSIRSTPSILLITVISVVMVYLILHHDLLTRDPAPVTVPQVICQPIEIKLGEKVAILRIDDVQGWAWPETTRRMIDDALSRGMVLTLGVIPKNLESDPAIISFLQERECNLEIALHGWDHAVLEDKVTPEFALLDEQQAEERLQRGLNVLTANFQSPVETWIPPQNVHSTGTVIAATKLGFTRLSTEGEAQWDYDATTWNYDTKVLESPEETMADCELSVAESGVCIIMLHPQNYTIADVHDEKLYSEYYLRLLDLLEAGSYTYVRFKDIDTE